MKWKEDSASVQTLNIHRLHYLILLVHVCIVLNQHTDHISCDAREVRSSQPTCE